MMRRILAALGVSTLAFVLFVQADEPAKPKTDAKAPTSIQEDARLKQEILARRFREFEQQLLSLAQRLERSAKQEDREKAQILKDAIKLANESGVDVRFNKLIDLLQKSKASNLQEVKEAIDQAELLSKNLRDILALLLTDSRDAQLKAEKQRLENLIKEISKLIREQKLVRADTERDRLDRAALEKAQQKVTEATQNVANAMGGKGQAGKGGEKSGEARGEGKNKGEGRGEAKEDSKGAKGENREGKAGEGKSGEGKAGEGKAGEPKSGEGKAGEGKSGEPKAGEGKSGEGKAGEGKAGEGKAGEGKAGEGKAGEGKAGEGKAGEGKAGEGKAGEGKAGEGKAGEGKAGDPKAGEAKAGEPKAGEPKADDPKAAKSGESRGQEQGKGQAKAGQGKAGEAKPGEAKAAGQGQPGQGQGQAKGGSPGGQPPQGAPPQAGPQQPQTPGREKVEDAIKNQKQAEDEIRNKDNPGASKNQDQAIKNLDDVRKRLEDILRQLREEEMERTLAKLQERCEEMLRMQREIYEGTVRVDKTVAANPDKKPTRGDEQKAQQLSDRQSLCAEVARKSLAVLEAEGSAVAFAEVFIQLIDDMTNVRKRLNKTDVGTFTQKVELDIIQTLEEMIEALKKAQQDLKQQQSKPMPPGQQGQPPKDGLIDILAELKMIRAMQLRVNKRTEDYGKLYPGEQANDADIQKELRNLGDRQDKIKKITTDIATGKNK